jgi:DNA-binding GntR family transcriptional regulator
MPDSSREPLGKIKYSSTLSNDIYNQIKLDIINGRFPPGEKLRIETMRQLYDIGNSPLREALTRLAANGLINQENQRGFRIPPVSREDLQDICNSRIHIEVAALKLAIAQGDDCWEAEILASYHRLKKSQENQEVATMAWEKRHTDFHSTLISACHSKTLLKFSTILHDQFDRYRRLAPNNDKLRAELDSQHLQIMRLSIDRKAEIAGDLLAVHIELSAKSALALFDEAN